MPGLNNDDVILDVQNAPVHSEMILKTPENRGVTRTGALANAPEKSVNASRDPSRFDGVARELFKGFSV